MKRFSIYTIALMGMFLLSACGGGDDGGSTGGGGGGTGGGGTGGDGPTGYKTYSQSVTLPASQTERTVTLSDLSSAVSSVSSSPSWLVVSPQFYSSGAPTLKLEAEENTTGSERQCVLTVLAASGDKVVLTVTQQGSGGGTPDEPNGIDDLHNGETDQPAYAPQR